VGADGRAQGLARQAAALALGAGIELPHGLALWRLAGALPEVEPVASADPAASLMAAMDAGLTAAERRGGAHYTPDDVADEVVARAVHDTACTVVDPTCGAGAVLLAAGRRLVALGGDRTTVAAERLWGADIDPLAAAVTEAAVALWSRGTAPEDGHVVAGDPLAVGARAWPDSPADGFGAVVGNPPFQGQLAHDTARGVTGRARLQERFGDVVTPYVDTAALFLLVGAELAAPGATVAMVQPQSTAAARDAGGVRSALADRSRLVELWVPTTRPFPARVHVCVPVLVVGRGEPADWAGGLAEARGVPPVELGDGPTVGSRATAVAGFRQHYYGLVGHVHEGEGSRLVTSGLIGLGRTAWGEGPTRFAKQRWERPAVELEGVRGDERLARWLDRVLVPKVVLATQTRVVEAAADREGAWVPCTPVVSVLPHDPGDVDRLVAALCAPPVAAWAARRASGTGLSPDAIRMSTALALSAPLPPDLALWEQASACLAAGDLAGYADLATAMHHLPPATAAAVLRWWRTNARQ
jgi:hypothetical protein